jgi:hypothetical protein
MSRGSGDAALKKTHPVPIFDVAKFMYRFLLHGLYIDE